MLRLTETGHQKSLEQVTVALFAGKYKTWPRKFADGESKAHPARRFFFMCFSIGLLET